MTKFEHFMRAVVIMLSAGAVIFFFAWLWVGQALASDTGSHVTILNPETNAGKVEANSGASTNTEIIGLDAAINFDGTVIPRNTEARLATVPQVTPPSVITGNLCGVGGSIGGSVVGFGLSGGFTKEGRKCELRQTVALLANMGYVEEALVLLCRNDENVEETFAALGIPGCRNLAANLPEQQPNPIFPSSGQRPVDDGQLDASGAVNTSSIMPLADPAFCADDTLYDQQMNRAWDEISPSCRARRVAVLAGATR